MILFQFQNCAYPQRAFMCFKRPHVPIHCTTGRLEGFRCSQSMSLWPRFPNFTWTLVIYCNLQTKPRDTTRYVVWLDKYLWIPLTGNINRGFVAIVFVVTAVKKIVIIIMFNYHSCIDTVCLVLYNPCFIYCPWKPGECHWKSKYFKFILFLMLLLLLICSFNTFWAAFCSTDIISS